MASLPLIDSRVKSRFRAFNLQLKPLAAAASAGRLGSSVAAARSYLCIHAASNSPADIAEHLRVDAQYDGFISWMTSAIVIGFDNWRLGVTFDLLALRGRRRPAGA